MAWVDPTGNVANGWSDPTFAYDNNIYSNASISVAQSSWSAYLEMTISAISCDSVRVYCSGQTTDIDAIIVGFYYGGSWHDNSQTSLSQDQYVTYNIGSTQTVTAMRVSLYNSKANTSRNAYICDADFNEIEGPEAYEESASALLGTSLVRNTSISTSKYSSVSFVSYECKCQGKYMAPIINFASILNKTVSNNLNAYIMINSKLSKYISSKLSTSIGFISKRLKDMFADITTMMFFTNYMLIGRGKQLFASISYINIINTGISKNIAIHMALLSERICGRCRHLLVSAGFKQLLRSSFGTSKYFINVLPLSTVNPHSGISLKFVNILSLLSNNRVYVSVARSTTIAINTITNFGKSLSILANNLFRVSVHRGVSKINVAYVGFTVALDKFFATIFNVIHGIKSFISLFSVSSFYEYINSSIKLNSIAINLNTFRRVYTSIIGSHISISYTVAHKIVRTVITELGISVVRFYNSVFKRSIYQIFDISCNINRTISVVVTNIVQLKLTSLMLRIKNSIVVLSTSIGSFLSILYSRIIPRRTKKRSLLFDRHSYTLSISLDAIEHSQISF